MPNTVKGVDFDPIREKLNDTIRHLRYCSADDDCFACERWNKDCGSWNCVNDLLKTAAELLESFANGVTVQQWISVKDRLPEPRENPVLVTYDGGVWMAWKHSTHWELPGTLKTNRVTHWMPLPEPPKGE